MYRRLVGILMYLTITPPDIAYVVNIVSQYVAHPHKLHLTTVHQILRYVHGTLHQGLFYAVFSLQHLRAYTDADWAECPDTHRSTT